MSDTIKRVECPKHGDTMVYANRGLNETPFCMEVGCALKAVERAYVLEGVERQQSIDALPSFKALHDGLTQEAFDQALGWNEAIRAAINAVTEEGT